MGTNQIPVQDSSQEHTPTNTEPDFLTTIVTQLFEPGSESAGSNKFDYVSLADALNSVRENVECDMQTLHALMLSMGFTTRTIDGVIYWIVKM